MLHVFEEAERIRIRQGPVLLEPLAIIAPLHVMETARVAPVVSRENASVVVDLDAECIPAPFGENFVAPGGGMITPDQLAERVNRRLVPRPFDVAGDRAPLRGIQPAVGAPPQIAGDRVRVLHAESFEMHDRIAVRHVVVVFVGIKKQVRRLQDPQSIFVESKRRRQAQAFDKRAVLIVFPVAVGVFVKRNAIEPLEMIRRRRRNLVVYRSQKFIAADHFQACRIGILDELVDPQPAARVPLDTEGLSHCRLAQSQLDFQIVGDDELFKRLGRRLRPGVVDALERLADFDCRFQFAEQRRACGRSVAVELSEGGVVAGAELPVARQPHGFFVTEQNRGCQVEPAAGFQAVNADGDDVGSVIAHGVGGDEKSLGPTQPAAEERRELARPADFFAVEKHLLGRVGRLDEQLEFLAFPGVGGLDEAAIPRQIVDPRRGILPDVGNFNGFPVSGGLGRCPQRGSQHQNRENQPERDRSTQAKARTAHEAGSERQEQVARSRPASSGRLGRIHGGRISVYDSGVRR